MGPELVKRSKATLRCGCSGEMFAVTTLDHENLPTENGKTDYTQDFFGNDFEFYHNHNIDYQFYGENNMIFKSNTGFRFDVYKDVYLNTSLRYDYETEPAQGAENEDTTFVFGVGAKF